MASELELKLAATTEKLNKIKQLDFPAAASQSPWQSKQLLNTYYDTANFKLRELSIGMRIRQLEGRFIQTVKTPGRAIGGLYQRNEDEIQLDANQLDITAISDPYLQILVEEAFEEDGEFIARFDTDFYRTQCLVTFSDGTKIEIALDSGTINAGEKSESICEVELELVEGSAEYVFAIGRYLIKELDLTLSNASKAGRGYSLCSTAPKSNKLMPVVELSHGVAAEQAFEQICYTGLRHWQHYELFLEKENAHFAVLEMYRALIYLHHMYIVFGRLIPRQATRDLRNNWSWLAKAMRPIVDAAKHKRHLMRYLKQKADWDLVEEQRKQIQTQVDQAITAFRELLATPRYNLMMLNMSQWLYFREWRDFMAEKAQSQLTRPIIDYAKKQLDHMLKELKRELGPKIDIDEQGYFKLIAKIRRALDTGLFFGGLFDSQKRVSYRQFWVEIIDQIRNLQVNQYIYQLQCETHSRQQSDDWLEQRNQPVLEALLKARKNTFKQTPYWI